jgi:hypothetical protein
MRVMRFPLDDKKDRTFRVQRWCFMGSIDLWESGGIGKLSDLDNEFCPHVNVDRQQVHVAGSI